MKVRWITSALLFLAACAVPAAAQDGLILDHRGDIDGAIAEYRKAIDLNPGDPQFYYRLGRVLQDQGDADAALRELQKASALEATNTTYSKAVEKLRQQMQH